MMSTLTIRCQWEDEMVRERTGHPPSYAEANKMKSQTLHTHGCLRSSLRGCSSYSSSRFKFPHKCIYSCYKSIKIRLKLMENLSPEFFCRLRPYTSTRLERGLKSESEVKCCNPSATKTPAALRTIIS